MCIRDRAQFFSGIGFEVENWRVFAAALILHGQENSVIDVVESGYGIRYSVDGELKCPSRQRVSV